MKGINPFIATILLIVVSILIFSIFSQWLTTYTQKASTEAGKKSEKRIICSYGSLTIDEVKYCDANNTLNITIINTGDISLGNVTLKIILPTEVKEYKLCKANGVVINCPISNLTLEPGDIVKINLELPYSPSSIESIVFTTNCSNIMPMLESSYFNSVC